jgi:hypothetical protein
MPTLRNRPPKYAFHKPTGQARVRIDGKDHYLGPYNSQRSIDEYNALIGELKAESLEPAVTNTTVSQLALAYVRFVKLYHSRDGKPTAEVSAVKVAVRRFRKTYGELLTAQVRPKHVEAFLSRLAKRKLSR